MPFIENLEEFAERQGCEYVEVDGFALFENGARSNYRFHSEPPTDEGELLLRRIKFFEVKLERAERLFRQCKSYIQTQAEWHDMGAGPPPVESAFEDLKRFQADVMARREQLAAMHEELAKRRGEPTASAYAKEVNERRARANDALRRANEIVI